MSKLTEYSAATRFDSGDILIKDGTGGTKKITAANAAVEFAGLVSAMNHRNVYRGKSLGSSVTAAQKATIQSGKFDDLFIGDYWSIGGYNYRIADMDYWYNCGDEPAFTKHHLVIVPDSIGVTAPMNDTDTTVGGYVGSKMYTETLPSVKNTISSAFGDMLLTHREYLVNAVTDGRPSAGAWFDSQVELMNEIMVYGCYVHTPAGDGVNRPTRHTINKQQLSLFRLNPTMVNRRMTYWLRDVVSASYFAFVAYGGHAATTAASSVINVRPVFAIG